MGPISGHKRVTKGGQNAIYRHLLGVNRIFFLQFEQKHYVSSLQLSRKFALKNIRYRGNHALPGCQKGGEMGPKC